MRTLLVDNHDSYTYNVFHLLAGVTGSEPIVVDNDAVSWRALSRWDFDAIVLSPGPGSPGRWHDFCVCNDILRYSEIPVLGICLGHQGLGHLLAGRVERAPEAMHGRLSRIHHEGAGLFAGIQQGFPVVRYHSLAISDMGPEGHVTAWADDGVVMGIEHTVRPMWGVQFHPESVATEHGAALVRNFYELARRRRSPRWRAAKRPRPAAPPASAERRAAPDGPEQRLRTIPGEPSTEALFERLFDTAEYAFWLDSADAPTRLAQRSYLGTSAGAERCVLSYDVEQGTAIAQRDAGIETVRTNIFDLLDREVRKRAVEPPPGLPPGLIGGFVGYLGYELKADCGSPNLHRSDIPDAVMMLATRLVAVDHVRRRTHLIARRPRPTRARARIRSPSASVAVASATWPTSPAARPSWRPASPMRSASPTRSTPMRSPTPSTSTSCCAGATPPPSPPT
jgi:para-aminobenzoate synthetase